MKYNFTAGPSIIPEEVKKKLIEAMIEFEDTGLSIIELSHRSQRFYDIIMECKKLVKDITGIGDDYEVLFIPGGSSSQFHMIPLNILKNNEKALYILSGIWANMALIQGEILGNCDFTILKNLNVMENISTGCGGYTYDDYKYIYITSNNTCYGTQFNKEYYPKVDHKNNFLVADMCSDIMSRRIDYNQFDIIHASIQKNIGISGVTLVIIKKSLIEMSNSNIPAMLSYKKHSEADSIYNTPPIVSIYSCLLTLKWIIKQGGLDEIEKKNIEKANLLYDFIDTTDFFFNFVSDKNSRSIMNIVFYMNSRKEEEKFLKYAESRGIVGIKYHKSVGFGFRVSLYNALPIEHVKYLIKVMKDFMKVHTKLIKLQKIE